MDVAWRASRRYLEEHRRMTIWLPTAEAQRFRRLQRLSGLRSFGAFLSVLLTEHESRRVEGTGRFVVRRLSAQQCHLALQAVAHEIEVYRRLVRDAERERNVELVEKLRRALGLFLDLEQFFSEAAAAIGEAKFLIASGQKVPRDRRRTSPSPS